MLRYLSDMSTYLRLNLPLLLPQIDHRDRCLQKLLEQLHGIKGVEFAHIIQETAQQTESDQERFAPPKRDKSDKYDKYDQNRHDSRNDSNSRNDREHVRENDREHAGNVPLLCLHYDPNLLALGRLERLVQQAGAAFSDRYRHENIAASNLTSANASENIERRLKAFSGMLHASVNPAAGMVSVAYDSSLLTIEKIREALQESGFFPSIIAERTAGRATDRTAASRAADKASEAKRELSLFSLLGRLLGPGALRRNRQLVASLLSGLLQLGGWLATAALGAADSSVIPVYAAAIILAGYDASRHAWRALIKLKFGTDLLMLMAAAGALLIDRWGEAAFLLFLFSLGHAGEHYALDRARNSIKSLGALLPAKALVRISQEGHAQFVERDINLIKAGDLVLVRPGDRIAVDGRIERGQGAINQSAITGESLPVLKKAGDQVFSGTISEESALEIRTERAAKDNTISRIIQMVAEAQSQKSPTQEFTRRFMGWFVPLVLLSSLTLILLPPLLGWLQWSESLYRGILLLIAASPCALALSTPSAVLAGIGQAARNGILIKGGVHLENLSRVRAIAFDKTGTLTEGELSLVDIVPQAGISENELLRVAASLEQGSSHPLAEAILASARKRGLRLGRYEDLKSIAGHGVRGYIDGEEVTAGSRRLFRDWPREALVQAEGVMDRLEAQGRSALAVARGGKIIGLLGFSDRVRAEAATAIEDLRRLRIRCLCMLTGDIDSIARRVGGQVGIADIDANLLPQEKLRRIQELERHHQAICMVGDGINDAPALATATVGIAMGGAGTAMALETADVALMGDRLDRLPYLIALSRKSRAIIRQNLWISLGTIVLLLAASFGGLLHLASAVALHEGSTIAVVLNALRLLRYKKD